MKKNIRYALIISCFFIAHGSIIYSMEEQKDVPDINNLTSTLSDLILSKRLLGKFDCINNILGDNNCVEKLVRGTFLNVVGPVILYITSSPKDKKQNDLLKLYHETKSTQTNACLWKIKLEKTNEAKKKQLINEIKNHASFIVKTLENQQLIRTNS